MSDENEVLADDQSESNAPFDADLIRKYPKSNRKLGLFVEKFGIRELDSKENNGQSQFISPHGVEFKSSESFAEGALLKIHVSLPDYWSRKQKFVDYARIDTPNDFRILAKVVRCEDVGKRGRKKIVICQTLVIDEVDEQVLKVYLQEG
jgi:hypothetical protein